MIPRKRIRLSAMQRVEVWRRWKAGESLHAIGRALGKNNVVIHLLLKRHGGIAPPIRRRSPSSLILAEREDISRGIACGSSIRGIAQGLHRCASTISREVARHGGRAQYRANETCTSVAIVKLLIALRLNQRPRKTLGFETPADILQASVASTP